MHLTKRQQIPLVFGICFIALGLIVSHFKIIPILTGRLTHSDLANAEQRALVRAANDVGVSPALLLAISNIETAGTFSTSIRPKRKNGSYIGSARGLCQFIKVMAKAYKLDWSGNDAYKQGVACSKLLLDNAKVVSKRIGRKAIDSEIYLAHVFGAGRAYQIISVPSQTSVVKTIGNRALKANRFLAKYKTAGGIRAWAERKIKGSKRSVNDYLAPVKESDVNNKLWLNRSE